MSKPKPACDRTTNWSTYNDALRKRESLLIWLDKEMTWHAPHEGPRGARRSFRIPRSSSACRSSIKVLFKLPLRQTAGMVASLLRLAGLDWPVADDSTLCRRQKTLKVQIPFRRADGPLNLRVDSTGAQLLGDGEWQARKHGVQSRRQWRKVHLAMDTATSDIRAVEFTPNREGDSPVLPDLLGQISEDEDIGHRHRDRGWCLRCPPQPQRRHRTRRHGNHTYPKARSGLERGLPGCQGAQRNPARHASLRSGILEAVDRIPRPQPRGGQDALLEGIR